LILRNETEWRYLVDSGMHVLVGNSAESIRNGAQRWLQPDALRALRAAKAPIWPGASERALDLIQSYFADERKQHAG
jgi:UDP-N-acetylglucosamine 2-epimerase (non-hydrolysing)